ncbi:MAG: hypothetical protein JXA03_13575 [Bacteroidales bacterium]|nr:hypothetical protein [Bacteroidales bacterium]
MNRKQFISTVAGATATTVVGAGALAANPASSELSAKTTAPNHKVKRGVALYSYQRAMMEKGMTLRDCLEEMSDIGAYGVEYMTHSLPGEAGYPNVTNKFVDEWWEMMDEFGTVPYCLTGFVESCRRKQYMTVEENVAFLERDFIIAKQLGMKVARLGPPLWVIEKAIPVAEKHGIHMAMEIHSPMKLYGEYIDYVVKLAEKFPHAIGFNFDMGIFQKYPRPLTRELQIKAGNLTRDIALYIEDSYRKGIAQAEVENRVKGMKPQPGDTAYVASVYRAGANCNDPKDLIPLLKYSKHMHGKCHEMTKGDEFRDATLIYDEVIPVLMQHGFDGYICTEFEGQRIGTIYDVDEVDEVRRQHVMLKRILGV